MTALVVGDWELGLRPDLGGAIARLTYRGADILRRTPDDAGDVLQTACFPLVPYANRIDQARFAWNGQSIALNPTPGAEPHALHGEGWRRAWAVTQQTDSSVTVALDYDGGDWPWAWRAIQRFKLTRDGLIVRLSITNRGDVPMPAGLGLHPYFARSPETRLTLSSNSVWLSDERLIPARVVPATEVFDWSGGADVAAAPHIDNAYVGWDGSAQITSRSQTVTLEASENAGWVHVFAPRDEDYVCVEPVTHRPNAFNAPDGEASGLVTLECGGALVMAMRVGRSDHPTRSQAAAPSSREWLRGYEFNYPYQVFSFVHHW